MYLFALLLGCFLCWSLGLSMMCSELVNTSLPCVEVYPCSSSNLNVSVVLHKLSDGSGSASSSSDITMCYNDSGLVLTQINYNQNLWTTSSSITDCNDPVSSSNSASIYIVPDSRASIQCFTELDVSPLNVSYHAGVFASRLPVPPQSFEMECNSSGLDTVTMIDESASLWEIDFVLSYSSINCPYNCPTPNAQCASLNTSFSNDDEDAGVNNAESIYRANFFRVNEISELTGNGQCSTLQNSGKCQTLAWTPTEDLHNTSNFGYILLQFEENAAEDYFYDHKFDEMYLDVSIIFALFVLLSALIYFFCFQSMQNTVPPPSSLVDKSIPVDSPPVDITVSNVSYYVPISYLLASTESTVYLFPDKGKVYHKQLLHSVNLSIEKRKVTAIMGPSGAGYVFAFMSQNLL